MPVSRRYSNGFAKSCQRGTLFAALLAGAQVCAADLNLAPPAAGELAEAEADGSSVDAADSAGRRALDDRELAARIKRLLPWDLGGSLSFNWRNVGPREPGFETQIQNQVYLADMYFAFKGPVLDGIPFLMEFNLPTGGQGTPSLYRFHFQYDRFENWGLQIGKFLVPYGRFNELYRPDMFLTITRPLLYASPDSLDLVVRINSPRPPFSSGYSDIGLRASYYPPFRSVFVPVEMTAFVVNGLSESSNRSRSFPRPQNLGIPPPPANGVAIDFGHENNNLADNNNNKAFGGRMVYALGDLRFPWPIPEAHRDLNGVALGASAMGGQYNLEAELNYRVMGADVSFEYAGANVSAEYMYSFTHFRSPLEATPSSTTLMSPTNFTRDFEEIQGYYVKASVPLLRRPRWGKRVTMILVYNRLFRRGPELDLLTNQTVNGQFFQSVAAYDPTRPRINRRISKLTGAFNWQLTEHFMSKLEYSYWLMSHASTASGTSDIYQGAMSIVLAF